MNFQWNINCCNTQYNNSSNNTISPASRSVCGLIPVFTLANLSACLSRCALYTAGSAESVANLRSANLAPSSPTARPFWLCASRFCEACGTLRSLCLLPPCFISVSTLRKSAGSCRARWSGWSPLT